jgi:pectinesterase
MFRRFLVVVVFLIAGGVATGEVKEFTVAADGRGDFETVQAAVDAVPAGNAERVVIRIQPGIYKEVIEVPREKPFVTFLGMGDDPAEVVLTFDNFASRINPETGEEFGTSGSASTVINGADFIAENVTFENSAGEVGQAVAIRIMSDRVIFRNCRFLGWQDTLYANSHGRNYFVDCYIEGRVDFIFGRSTAVFENCEIHSKNGGYVTAASTPEERESGYVFLNCRLTGWGEPAYLGRPWRPHAHVAFISCAMGEHIRPEGWHNWGREENEQTARFEEFGNTGPGADTSRRVAWAKQLSEEEAARYTVENVLGWEDGWDPRGDARE